MLVHDRLLTEASLERGQRQEIESRLQTIQEEVRRYSDLEKLTKYGSLQHTKVAGGTCPVCDRPYADGLLRQDNDLQVMTVSQNVALLREQSTSFKTLAADVDARMELRQKELDASSREIALTQTRIRALKASLVSRPDAPSVSQVREALLLEDELDSMQRLEEEFGRVMHELGEVGLRSLN